MNVVDDRMTVFRDHVEMHLLDGILDLVIIHAGPELEADADIGGAILARLLFQLHILQRTAILRIGDHVVTEGITRLAVVGVIGRMFCRFVIGRLKPLAEQF